MEAESASVRTRWQKFREWAALGLSAIAIGLSGFSLYQQGQFSERSNDITEFHNLQDDVQDAFSTIFEGLNEGQIEREQWIADAWSSYENIGDEPTSKTITELQSILGTIRAKCSPLNNASCPSMVDPTVFRSRPPLDVYVPESGDTGGS